MSAVYRDKTSIAASKLTAIAELWVRASRHWQWERLVQFDAQWTRGAPDWRRMGLALYKSFEQQRGRVTVLSPRLVNSSHCSQSLILTAGRMAAFSLFSASVFLSLSDSWVGSGTMPVSKRTENSRAQPTRRPVDPTIVVVNELWDVRNPPIKVIPRSHCAPMRSRRISRTFNRQQLGLAMIGYPRRLCEGELSGFSMQRNGRNATDVADA